MNVRATRFPLFDSLRAIAALAVFGTHSYFALRNNAPSDLRPYAARLDVGVYIFFVISGFLLYRPFVRARLRGGGPPSTGATRWRRLLRIGPAYWVALTVVALWLGYSYVFEPENAVWFYPFGQSYRPGLVIGGLTQAWSLSVEAAFYVMLPLYAFAMRSLAVRGERGVPRGARRPGAAGGDRRRHHDLRGRDRDHRRAPGHRAPPPDAPEPSCTCSPPGCASPF